MSLSKALQRLSGTNVADENATAAMAFRCRRSKSGRIKNSHRQRASIDAVAGTWRDERPGSGDSPVLAKPSSLYQHHQPILQQQRQQSSPRNSIRTNNTTATANSQMDSLSKRMPFSREQQHGGISYNLSTDTMPTAAAYSRMSSGQSRQSATNSVSDSRFRQIAPNVATTRPRVEQETLDRIQKIRL